jgi:hypothetical protein
MKRLKSRPAVFTFAFVILSAICLSTAVVPSKGSMAGAQRARQGAARCEAAVKRVQKAVTAQTHAFVNAMRTSCQVASLPPESRAGKGDQRLDAEEP